MKSIKNIPENPRRDFVECFEKLSYKNGRRSVWSDFVYMTAAMISSAVDKAHAAERGEQLKKLEAKYSEEEQRLFAQMFAAVVSGLETNPDQDFLGQIFMELDLGNEYAGQFFTPYGV